MNCILTKPICWPILFFAAAIWLCSSLHGRAESASLAGRTIDFEMVHRTDFSPISTQSHFTIRSEEVSVKPGDRIAILLRDAGINPDIEAYTLVFDLNPKINKLDDFTNAATILLPSVVGDSAIRDQLHRNGIVLLTVDKDLKDSISTNANVIQEMVARLSRAGWPMLNRADSQTNAVDQLKDVSGWFGYIRSAFSNGTGRCLSRDSLVMLNEESRLTKTLLDNMCKNQTLSSYNFQQVTDVHADLSDQIQKFDDVMSDDSVKRDPECEVEVTLIAGNTNAIYNIRVYYVPDWDYPPDSSAVDIFCFRSLGSPVSQVILDKDYRFWAAKDGDPFHPITPATLAAVRQDPSGKPFSLMLSIAGAK